MEKELLFQLLLEKMVTGEVSRAEIAQRLGLANVTQQPSENSVAVVDAHHFTVTKMLYVLGAAIVTIGIILFVAQIWDDLGSLGRIIITLGLGLLFALLGSLLMKQKSAVTLGGVFQALGGVLIPFGGVVALVEIDPGTNELWYLTAIFSSIFLFYAILTVVHKHAVLTFFAIANGTAVIYLLTSALLDPVLDNQAMEDVLQYVTMALGGSYLLLAHTFAQGWNARLVGLLHFFGITGLLGAAFVQVFDSTIWELFYFLLVFGALFVSVYMKSRIILIMSTLFLLAHVTYITSEYFADSLGWPIALVLLGFVFIGLGYASIMINKTYITSESAG